DHTLDPGSLQTNCLDLAPTLSSAYLTDVSTCIEGDCSQVVPCLKRTEDRYQTDLSLDPTSSRKD
ncbi:MAG: hypothetical protein JWN04_909, partial [Myxococcaceae bacterium]|nr:hypothetical protein [Myxococcaceae bacterium]